MAWTTVAEPEAIEWEEAEEATSLEWRRPMYPHRLEDDDTLVFAEGSIGLVVTEVTTDYIVIKDVGVALPPTNIYSDLEKVIYVS